MQKKISSKNKAVLVVGFMFEGVIDLKHNLISPNVLAFFDGVQESEEVTDDCAFPLPISSTNLRQSIFQYIGEAWAVCSDGIFRKCQKVNCNAICDNQYSIMIFHIDKSLTKQGVNGFIYLP